MKMILINAIDHAAFIFFHLSTSAERSGGVRYSVTYSR